MKILFNKTLFKQYSASFLEPRAPSEDASQAAQDCKRALLLATFNKQPFSIEEIKKFNYYFEQKDYTSAQWLVVNKLLKDATEAEKQYWMPHLNVWLDQGGFMNTLGAVLSFKTSIEGYDLQESEQNPEKRLGRQIDLRFDQGTLWITERITYDKLKILGSAEAVFEAEADSYILKAKRRQAMKLPTLGSQDSTVEILAAEITLEYENPVLDCLNQSLAEDILEQLPHQGYYIDFNNINLLSKITREIGAIKHIYQPFEGYCKTLSKSDDAVIVDLGDKLQRELKELMIQVLNYRLGQSESFAEGLLKDSLNEEKSIADMALWEAYQDFKLKVQEHIDEYKAQHPSNRINSLLEKILEALPRLAEHLYKLMKNLPIVRQGFFREACARTGVQYHAERISQSKLG